MPSDVDRKFAPATCDSESSVRPLTVSVLSPGGVGMHHVKTAGTAARLDVRTRTQACDGWDWKDIRPTVRHTHPVATSVLTFYLSLARTY
jgi:hypothetical protein